MNKFKMRFVIYTLLIGSIGFSGPLYAFDYFLGQGYASDFEKGRAIECLVGDIVVDEPGDTQSTLIVGYENSFEKEVEKRTISVSGNGSLYDGVVKLDGSYKEVKESVETDFRSVVSFYYTYNGPVKRYRINTGIVLPLNNLAMEAYSVSDYSFYSLCGDKYVSSVEYGGLLEVSIALNFATKYEKESYEASNSGTYADFASVSNNLELLKESYGNDLKVSIYAHQIGGDSANLGDLILSNTGSSLGDCDVETGKCSSILDFLTQYVSSQGSLNEAWRANPAPVSLNVSPYSSVIPNYSIPAPLVPDEVGLAREEIYAEYMKQIETLTVLESYLVEYNDADIQARWDSISDDTEELIANVKYNMEKLVDTMEICYSDFSSCYESYIETLSLIRVIAMPAAPVAVYPTGEIYVGKSAMELNCDVPSNSVVVGVGARVSSGAVRGIRLGYKSVMSDGSLGSTQYIQCGNGYEEYIEAPDGNVLVGVGARISSDDIQGIKIVSAPWNSDLKIIDHVYTTQNTRNSTEEYIDLRTYQSEFILLSDDHSVITGVGMREKNDNMAGLTIRVGWIE